MTNTATQTVPLGGNRSVQLRYDGTNISLYFDGQLITPTPGQNHTFVPATKGPYYLVMSFANGDQNPGIPAGQTTPPTNFTLQVTSSELFGGTNLLGTTLTHLQTFTTNATFSNTAPGASPTPALALTKDAINSSATPAEVVYNNGSFTYTPSDGSSRAMINLTINVSAGATFNMRYLIFAAGQTVPKATVGTGPTIPASGTGTAWGLTMKTSFILNAGDYFILQAWGPASANFTTLSNVIVEKLPVAQGGGAQRWVNIQPIPKRHPTRKSSLRVSRVSTKKGGRR